MNLVKISCYCGNAVVVDGKVELPSAVEDIICPVGLGTLHSIIQLRQLLQTYASRLIGGREGRDWEIRPTNGPAPLYARSNDGIIELRYK